MSLGSPSPAIRLVAALDSSRWRGRIADFQTLYVKTGCVTCREILPTQGVSFAPWIGSRHPGTGRGVAHDNLSAAE